MRLGKYTIFLLIGLLFFAGKVFSQNTPEASSIDEQFEEILKTSNNYQDYKVVKRFKISNLRTATLQEINQLSEQIESLKEENKQHTQELKQLEEQLKQTNADLEKAEKSKDEFSWLGMQVQKGSYQSVVYGIIIFLVLVLLVLFFTYQKNKNETVQAKKNLEQNQAEFDAYRKKSLETQQKLGRQLQDERMRKAKE